MDMHLHPSAYICASLRSRRDESRMRLVCRAAFRDVSIELAEEENAAMERDA